MRPHRSPITSIPSALTSGKGLHPCHLLSIYRIAYAQLQIPIKQASHLHIIPLRPAISIMLYFPIYTFHLFPSPHIVLCCLLVHIHVSFLFRMGLLRTFYVHLHPLLWAPCISDPVHLDHSSSFSCHHRCHLFLLYRYPLLYPSCTLRWTNIVSMLVGLVR